MYLLNHHKLPWQELYEVSKNKPAIMFKLRNAPKMHIAFQYLINDGNILNSLFLDHLLEIFHYIMNLKFS